MPAPPAIGRWRFGLFEFDSETLELRRSGRAVRLRPQALKLLAILLARPGELVSREELQRALWGGDTFVDFEQGVNHAVRELRAALGDAAESPRYIETLPRRGYRFIAPASQVPEPEAPHAAVRIAEQGPTAAPPVRRWWPAALAAAAGIVGIVAAYLVMGAREAAPVRASALVVRPFASPDDSAFGVGLANAITARLGGQRALVVRSGRNAGGTDGTAHVLDGEIHIAQASVTVNARLRDAAGTITWSERFRLRADELFSLEDVIAERVVSALRLQMAAGEQARLRRRYTANNTAYSDYLRGRAALVRYTPESTMAGIAAFERALQRDPAYALARAGLAMACADMHLRFAPPPDVERWGARAEAEARAALELDPELPEAHLARAAVARKREFDWNATVAASRRALALNPNLDQARFFVAAAYYHHGYMEEALIEMEKGRSLHGIDTIEPMRIAALVALFSGDFAPARARLEEVSRASSQAIGDTYLALAHYYSGSVTSGRATLEQLAESRSASTAARAGAALAGVLAAEQERRAARDRLTRVLAGGYRDHHVAYSVGAAYAQLGEWDAADRWLRTAADTGFPCLPFYERDPLLEPLRARPEFRDLLDYVRTRRRLSLTDGSP